MNNNLKFLLLFLTLAIITFTAIISLGSVLVDKNNNYLMDSDLELSSRVPVVVNSENVIIECRNIPLLSSSRELCPQFPFLANSRKVLISNIDFPSTPELSPQLIPRVIFQTNTDKSVPVGMALAIDTVKNNNPEYFYYYFNDEESDEFIRSNFSDEFYQLYDSLVPGAFRSDIFRAAFLLKNGGVYMDTGFVEMVPLRELIRENDTFIAPEDNLRTNEKESYIHNAFMASVPNHPIIKEYLSITMERIKSRDYSYGLHGITGPRVVGEAFERVIGKLVPGDHRYGIRIIRSIYYKDLDSAVISAETDPNKVRDNPLFYSKSIVYRSEQKSYNQPHYDNYFKNRQVFGESGGLPTLKPREAKKEKKSERKKTFIRPLSHSPPLKKKFELVSIPSIIPVSVPLDYHQKIPKVIIRTDNFKEIPENMRNAMKSFERLNPEYEFLYFDDVSCREFISSNYPERVVKAFDDIIPGAYKADIFRICYLLKKGGVYTDSGQICSVPLRNFIGENDEFICPEDNGCTITRGHPHLYNAFIAATKNHPVLERCLSKIVENIENRDYSKTDLGITGPRTLGEAFYEVYNFLPSPGLTIEDKGVRIITAKQSPEFDATRVITDGKEYGGYPERILIFTKYNKYNKEREKYSVNSVRYGKMFEMRKVYIDEN